MNRKIVLGSVGASALVLAAWFFLLWQPKGDELGVQQERIETAEADASTLETRILQLGDAKKRAPQLTAELDRLRSAVPDEPNLAQFILDANDAAVQSGVSFVSIAPQPPAPSQEPGLPPQIGLAVDIEGGYFQVLDFMQHLTDLPRVVVVDTVTVSPEEGVSPQLTVNLAGRMFTNQLPVTATPATPAPADGAPTTTVPATEPTTPTTVVPE